MSLNDTFQQRKYIFWTLMLECFVLN